MQSDSDDRSKNLPRVFTLLNVDIEPRVQEIEIASSLQIPAFQIIGLPGPEVSEAKDRIRSAIESSGFDFPRRKLVLNLSPASVRKQGTGLDLAMALAVLLEGLRIERSGLPLDPDARFFAWGELGLDARVKPVGAPARAIASAISSRASYLFVSLDELGLFRETRSRLFAGASGSLRIFGVETLREVLLFLRRGELPSESAPSGASALFDRPTWKCDARSLLPLPRMIERTISIAASGAHHFLLLGPKGAGKSHALEWFLALLPELDLETIRVRSYLGEMSGKTSEAAFRRVGTQARPASLLGSFASGRLRPGELSLAHGGALLADEFPEWSRDAREALREPLERRRLSLTRVDGSIELPSDFIFAGNGNLCPCGGIPESPSDESEFACRCHPLDRMRYLSRLSGPILDRLDIVSVLRKTGGNETAAPEKRSAGNELVRLREDVENTRRRLLARYGALPGKMEAYELEGILDESPEFRTLLDRMKFRSFRDRHKTFRIALTLAALRSDGPPTERDFLEARVLRTESDSLLRPA